MLVYYQRQQIQSPCLKQAAGFNIVIIFQYVIDDRHTYPLAAAGGK